MAKNESAPVKAKGAQKTKENKNGIFPNKQTEYSVDEVQELLSHIPPPSPKTNSREYWLKIIAATCAALGGNESAALDLLKNWQEEWHKNAYETAIKSLRGNYKSTAATLVYFAQQNGYDASAKAKERVARERASVMQKTAETPPQTASAKKDTPATRARVLLGKCSIVESCRKPETVKETDLLTCLRKIKTGKWKSEVDAVRAGTRDKSTLPQVCAFGVYSARRADENLMTQSGFLVLDYDSKDNSKTDFRKLRERLAKLPFILAVFTSPRGNGLKALIRIPETVSDTEAFAAAVRVLAPLGGKLDAGSEARKHFIVSYDSAAFISETPLDEIPSLTDWENLPPVALAVIFAETVENFYFAGTEDYFFNDAGTIKKLSVSAATQEFEVSYGANRKTARNALYAVRKSRYVHRVFPALTCHTAGLHVFDKKPALVLSSPEILNAYRGTFPTIKKLLETVFTNEWEQLARFLAWLQHARRAFLQACESNGAKISPVPLLMILGTAGAGKDLLFQTLIRPALGDRQHAPADTFPQEKQWLGGIIGAECVLASEMRDLNTQERSQFKATIKQIIGGSGYSAESKGKNAFTFKGQHFIVLLANIDDGGNCAAACPAIDEDFRDKFLAITATNAAAVKAAFDGLHAAENAAAIRRELPAFLFWLENCFDVPATWKDERFGVAGYCAPKAETALFEVSRESEIFAFIKELVLDEKSGEEITNKPLTAIKLAGIIETRFYKKYATSTFGKALRKLAKDFPQWLTFNGSNSSPVYRLKNGEAAALQAEPVPAVANPLAGVAF